MGVVIVGYVRVKGVIANPFDRSRRVEVEFVADTGAIYTMIPRSIAKELGLEEIDRRRFRVASGEVVEYPVSEAYIIIENRGVTSLVVIGSEKNTTTTRSYNTRTTRIPSRSNNRKTKTHRTHATIE